MVRAAPYCRRRTTAWSCSVPCCTACSRTAAARRSPHEPALGQGNAARRARARLHRGRGPRARRPPRCLRRARLDRARRDARGGEGCSLPPTSRRSATGSRRSPSAHARGEWRVTLEEEDGQTALENRLTARSARPAHAIHLGRSRNDQVLAALRLYLRDAAGNLAQRRGHRRRRARGARRAAGRTSPCPATRTCSRRCRPASDSWARGFATEVRDDAEGLRADRSPHRPQSARLGRRLRHARACRCRARRRARGSGLRKCTSP